MSASDQMVAVAAALFNLLTEMNDTPSLLSGEIQMCSFLLASFDDSGARQRSTVPLTVCLVCLSIFLTCSP